MKMYRDRSEAVAIGRDSLLERFLKDHGMLYFKAIGSPTYFNVTDLDFNDWTHTVYDAQKLTEAFREVYYVP